MVKGAPSSKHKEPNRCRIISRVIGVVSISAISLSLLHYMYGISFVDHKGKTDHMGAIVVQQQRQEMRQIGAPAGGKTEPITPIAAEDQSTKAVSESNTWTTDTFNIEPPIPWNNFIHGEEVFTSAVDEHTRKGANTGMEKELRALEQVLNVCSDSVETALKTPQLNTKQYEWCQWTLQNDGGQVQVGKSYGKLNAKERDQYEQWNCNSVAEGRNPSCDDTWGDAYIKAWKRNAIPDLCGNDNRKHHGSKINCYDSSSKARFCKFENVMMDFSKMHTVPVPTKKPRKPVRGGRPAPPPPLTQANKTRTWDSGFLATDCSSTIQDIGLYPFYKPFDDAAVSGANGLACDYVVKTPVLAMSHDNIYNIGHSLSDIMNVWAMLWLAGGTADDMKQMHFMNIDAIRLGKCFDDNPSPFFRHYEVSFKDIIKAADFGPTARVCFKKLIMQPKPLILFTWDGWWQDMRCSFVGPSSLFQRWNLQLRMNYGLLPMAGHTSKGGATKGKRPAVSPLAEPTVTEEGGASLAAGEKLHILLIIRNTTSTSQSKTRRVFKNPHAIIDTLQRFPDTKLTVQDLAVLTFEEQVRLMNRAGLVIGVHGAGIAQAMHMPIGTPNCCGVVEIFPKGEFMTIRGYGNMARRMGHHYARMQISSDNSFEKGVLVPTHELQEVVATVIRDIAKKPSCVLRSVLDDPYLR